VGFTSFAVPHLHLRVEHRGFEYPGEWSLRVVAVDHGSGVVCHLDSNCRLDHWMRLQFCCNNDLGYDGLDSLRAR
jgi:hypothetical protein